MTKEVIMNTNENVKFNAKVALLEEAIIEYYYKSLDEKNQVKAKNRIVTLCEEVIKQSKVTEHSN